MSPMQSFNSFSALLLWRTSTLRCRSDSCRTKKTADQYTCQITGSLISISVFLFARHKSRSIGRKPFYWFKIGIKWQLAKQWVRWSITLHISLAQTLKYYKFWKNSITLYLCDQWWTKQVINQLQTWTRESADLLDGQIFCLSMPA